MYHGNINILFVRSEWGLMYVLDMNKYNIDTLILELDYIVDHHNVTINMLITYSNHSFFVFAKKFIRSLLNLSLTI